MGVVVSFLVAGFVAATVVTAIDHLARRGHLNSGAAWYTQGPAWVILSHLLSLVVLWVLKSLEVGAERSGAGAFEPWCGIVRRLDDLSWWTMIMGTVVGTTMIWYSGGLTFSGTVGQRVRLAWRVMAPLGLALYTVAVCIGDGTFFWQGSSAFITRLQCIEGAVVMTYILTSYLFIASLVDVIIARRPWGKVVTISILVGGVLGLVGIASALCGVVGTGWSSCGFRQQPNYSNGRFWVFAALVWWPWILVFVVSLFASGPPPAPPPSSPGPSP